MIKQKRPRGSGRIYKRGEYWWIKYHRNGKPYWESSKSNSRSEAEKLLKSRLGEIADDRFVGTASGRVTVGMLLDLVAEDYRITGKRSVDDLEWRCKKHLRPRFDKMKAVQFGSLQIKRYIDERRKENASDATVNRELAILQRGFSLALASDPPLIARAPHFPKLQIDNARGGFLEHSQYIALRQALPDHLKCLLVVGYHVGCRLGELRKLKWDQADLKAKEIRLTAKQTKGKRGRVIPIWGDMAEWLEMEYETRGICEYVFHWHGKPIGAHVKGWRAACKAAGVPNLLPHDLRRSAVRNMERAGIPRKLAMEISGHKTESIYRRYDIVSSQDLRNAAVKMEAYQKTLGTAQESLGTKTASLGTKENPRNRAN
jgi:integrase